MRTLEPSMTDSGTDFHYHIANDVHNKLHDRSTFLCCFIFDAWRYLLS
jgi:hypothetical protein